MFKSIIGTIESCEMQICWSGIVAIFSNGELDDLYDFRDSLAQIGSKRKKAILDKVIAILEQPFQRKPTDDEAYDILDDNYDSLQGLDKEYSACHSVEVLEELAFGFLQGSPEQLKLLEQDRGISEMADRLFIRIVGDSARLPELKGEVTVVAIDLGLRTGCMDSGEVVASFEPELGELTPGNGACSSREAILSIVQKQWGTPIEVRFVNCAILEGSGLPGKKAVYELQKFFPTLFTGIRQEQIKCTWHQ